MPWWTRWCAGKAETSTCCSASTREPVRLTKLTLVGLDSILDVAGVKRTLPLQEGAPFNRLLFQASADTIADRLRNAGYPYADVLRNYDVDAAALHAEASL